MSTDDVGTRPLYDADAIARFLPSSRGPFVFPHPYNTRGVRLTDESDGNIWPVGYSYWRRINLHRGESFLRVLVSRHDQPALCFSVDKASGVVIDRIELGGVWGTGEQWYWSVRDPNVFYLLEGAALLRYNVITRQRETVLDPGGSVVCWQPHSNDDGTVHSATLRVLPDYADTKIVIGYPSWQRLIDLPEGYDECQIDAGGRFLIVKMHGGADNEVHNLDSGVVTFIANAAGALGHSDSGPGYAVGENDYHTQPGAFEKVNLANPYDRVLVYHTTDWQAMGRHVALAWDRPNPIAIISAACRVNVPRANEIVAAPLDGSLRALVIAPNLVDMNAPDSLDGYQGVPTTPEVNVDNLGEWICWSANHRGTRQDVFLAQVPPL